MTRRNASKLALILGVALAASPSVPGGVLPAMAQDSGGLFSPRIIINGQAISNYEVEQRVRFLQVLRVPGDPEKEALKALVTDRLGTQEAKRHEVKLTPQQIEDGMREFASRANLDVAGFVKAIQDEGVEEQTFRDFVTAGLLWREVVRKKFGDSVRVSEVQIDRAMAEAARKPDVKLLLSELVVPVPDGTDPAEVLAEVRDIKANLGAEGGFAAAARKYSASPTAPKGGQLDWLPVSNLPPAIARNLLILGAGEVSDPVVVPQAVVLFQLNGIGDMETPPPADVKVSYAQLTLAPDQDGAAILASIDQCADLYPIMRGQSPDRLKVTEDVSMAAVPQDIGLALAPLDPGEGVLRSRGGAHELLMLCLRNGIQPAAEAAPEAAAADGATSQQAATAEQPAATEAQQATTEGQSATTEAKPDTSTADGPEFVKPDPEREKVRNDLGNRQIAALADAYMEELRSEAIIETP